MDGELFKFPSAEEQEALAKVVQFVLPMTGFPCTFLPDETAFTPFHLHHDVAASGAHRAGGLHGACGFFAGAGGGDEAGQGAEGGAG